MRIAAVVIAAIVATAGAAYLLRGKDRATPHYETAPADRGTIAPVVISSGTVNPVTTVQVGTYVSGVIQTISCDFNTRVKAGQLCAKIDPRPYQSLVDQADAALATARAQVAKDRANLAYAQQIRDRNVNLLGRGIVSQETVDTSVNAYLQAVAQLALDKATLLQRAAQLKAARINLGYTDIASPVDGTVVSRNVTQGQTVAASFQTPTLFLIAADLTEMQVDTNVSESDIGRVRVGNEAAFTVESYPDRQFRGQVQQVRQAPLTVQNVVTYDVVVAVSNPDLALKPGMTASMRITTNRVDNALRVPNQALRFKPAPPSLAADAGAGRGGTRHAANAEEGGKAREARTGAVWVLADGRPKRVPLQLGLDDDQYSQVLGGALQEGQQVILSERPNAPARGRPPAAGMFAPAR
ncbi:efflux RND transporter periplasmic adaptor subunit [Noviherbaspirillum soli]|uniref:efflux RND transporter periplasmic adaptor subunit n=1 Tax=Noviherbaspirillum soli TaxID=1064518 RepID=UPI001E48633B|nr:efflux RND transporter periplasmic adaptor subunit [Noviherbaspirillum soli]